MDTSHPDIPPTRTRTPLWVRVALVLSLVLNLAIIGFVVGFLLRGPVLGSSLRVDGTVFGLRALPRSLPDSQQTALRRDLFGQRHALRAVRQDLLALRRDFLAELRRDPFDRAATEALFTRYRDTIGAAEQIGWGAILRRLDDMSLEDRMRFAENLERRRGHGERTDPARRDR